MSNLFIEKRKKVMLELRLKQEKLYGFGRGGGIIGGGQKPKNIKETIGKLLKYLGVYKYGLLCIMLVSCGASLCKTFSPRMIGRGTDVIYQAVERAMITNVIEVDMELLSYYIILLLGLAFGSFVFSMIQNFSMSKLANKMTHKMRSDVFEKINRLPLKYFDNNSIGDIMSRAVNDVDSLNQSLRQIVIQVATAVTMLVGTITMMIFISPKLTLVAITIIPMSMLIIAGVVKVSQPLFRKQQRSVGMLNAHVEEMLSSHTIVKSFNMEDDSITLFNEFNNELRENAWRSQVSSNMMVPLSNLISNMGYIVCCVLGAGEITSGVMTIGDVTAFIEYVRSINQPIQQLANMSTQFQSALACAERVFEFLDQEEEEVSLSRVTDTGDIVGNVAFENVSFGYEENITVINNFSIEVKQSEKIAIVGPTGAGKTTLVKLLMRYYELNGGAISIDGNNIRDFDRNQLRRMFGMVLQDTWLFKGTIRDNIVYSKPDATEEEVMRAASISQLDHFVKTLAQGYEFELNEETSNISAGQKQLITIARAFLQNPKILILDEATSSVDTRTEVLIQQAMENLMKNRTSFVIAHRLSTIRDADKIIVMDHGDIVEIGSHDELIAKGGFYLNLYKSQFENSAS